MMKNQLRVYKIKLIDLFTPIKLMPLKVRNTYESKKWWNKVNNMTGRIGNILPISSTGCIKKLNKFEIALNVAKRLKV